MSAVHLPDSAADELPAYRLHKLRKHDGKTTSLASAAGGRLLVVVVLKGTWCQVCVGQMQRLAKVEKRLEKLGTRVVGLTHESHTKAKAVAKDSGLPFPILSDPKHEVLAALGLWRDDWGHPLPAMVVFDRCGDERGRMSGRGPGDQVEKSLLEFLKKLADNPASCELPSV
jgi:peroxiredoxin